MSYSHTQVAQIVAISNNRCIGKNNQLPWHIKEDLQHFKAMTTAKTDTDSNADSRIQGIVIMGRKTFESMGAKPLPKRANFVITTQLDYAEKQGLVDNKNVHVVHNLDDALTYAANLAHGLKFDTMWIIGGQKVFEQAMMYTDRIELTKVDTTIENGEVFYPHVPKSFTQTHISEQKIDKKSGLAFQFVRYEKK